MTVIATPEFFDDPTNFSLRLVTNQLSFASPEGGSEQVVDRLNDRWAMSVTVSPRWHEDAAALEAYIASLRGMVNTTAIHHLARPQPRGTMDGAPTVAAAAAGAGFLAITTTPGATLLAGDMVGVGGLLLQAASDATANGSGVMVLPIVNRLRRSVPGGAAVTWDRPTVPFRLISQSSVQYIPGHASEVTFDFVEAIG